MADRVAPGPVDSSACIREAVCIHTKKIFSSCRDKDCVEDLYVYPTSGSQPYIDAAVSIRPKSAELLWTGVNVNEITFNRGYYTVDVSYFYRVKGEVFPGNQEVTGLAVFNKRVILFGSEGSVKLYSSDMDFRPGAAQPVGVVEAVDPIVLAMKIAERSSCPCQYDPTPDIPGEILAAFPEELFMGTGLKNWYVTLGQFSLIRLERDSQLVIPLYNYCFPEDECVGPVADDPCTLFGRIRFPVEEFNPPDSIEHCENYRNLLQ